MCYLLEESCFVVVWLASLWLEIHMELDLDYGCHTSVLELHNPWEQLQTCLLVSSLKLYAQFKSAVKRL